MNVIDHFEITEEYQDHQNDEKRHAAGIPNKRPFFGWMAIVDELSADLLTEQKHLRRGVCVTDGTKVWEVTGLERHPTGSGGVGLRAALRLELPLPAIGVVLRIVGSES